MATSETFNPQQVEEAIRQCSNRIAKSVQVCGKAYDEYTTALREYDQAYAHAYLNASGPAHEKRYRAEVATLEQRTKRDIADAAYKYAERTSKAVIEELRAWQSVGASVRAMYSVAGRGEGM